MKSISFATMSIVLAFGLAPNLLAQQLDKEAIDSFDKKVTEFARPNENHKRLVLMVGTWNCTTQFWLSPDSKPVESSGQYTGRLILGGRYLNELYTDAHQYKQTKTDDGGDRASGYGLTGYNNATGLFQTTWIGTDTTEIEFLQGKYDEEKKEFNFKGKIHDPAGEITDMRANVRFEGTNKFVQTNYASGPGIKEYKKAETVYIRAE